MTKCKYNKFTDCAEWWYRHVEHIDDPMEGKLLCIICKLDRLCYLIAKK